ncbi:MAG: hypothetical protein Q4A75_04770 [Peptostreptococcaceae bacterium]|nr:hypothetical protein [Peptostreptococcaceae bacterium]
MRQRLKQKMAIALCIISIGVLLHYSFMISDHAMHHCKAIGCSACKEIRHQREMFSYIKLVKPCCTPLVFVVVFFVGFIVKNIDPEHPTLVAKKVRLDD